MIDFTQLCDTSYMNGARTHLCVNAHLEAILVS